MHFTILKFVWVLAATEIRLTFLRHPVDSFNLGFNSDTCPGRKKLMGAEAGPSCRGVDPGIFLTSGALRRSTPPIFSEVEETENTYFIHS